MHFASYIFNVKQELLAAFSADFSHFIQVSIMLMSICILEKVGHSLIASIQFNVPWCIRTISETHELIEICLKWANIYIYLWMEYLIMNWFSHILYEGYTTSTSLQDYSMLRHSLLTMYRWLFSLLEGNSRYIGWQSLENPQRCQEVMWPWSMKRHWKLRKQSAWI